MKFLDKHGLVVEDGDIIDLCQTVNGENIFIVFDIEKLDIRYSFDLTRKYEYCVESLLSPSSLNGDIDFKLIGNIYKDIKEKYK
jgi:hypothetical protein